MYNNNNHDGWINGFNFNDDTQNSVVNNLILQNPGGNNFTHQNPNYNNNLFHNNFFNQNSANNDDAHQDTIYNNSIHQYYSNTPNNPVTSNTNTGTIYQNVNDNNSVHQNMFHNHPIHQNLGEIYQNFGDNNSVHQNMVHQNPEGIHQNSGNNNYIRQNMIYNHQNNFIAEQNSGNITSTNYQNSVNGGFVGQNSSKDQQLIYITLLLQNIQNVWRSQDSGIMKEPWHNKSKSEDLYKKVDVVVFGKLINEKDAKEIMYNFLILVKTLDESVWTAVKYKYPASNNGTYQVDIHQYYSSSDFVRQNNRIPDNNGLSNHAPTDAMRITHQNSARNNRNN
nr:14763_t:CDS:2 [Entrophospora candida]